MPIPIGAALAAKTLLSTAATTAVRNAPKLINPLAQQATRAASQMPLASAARPAADAGINQLRSNLLPALKQSAVDHGKQALVDGVLSALQQSRTQAPGPVPHNGEVLK